MRALLAVAVAATTALQSPPAPPAASPVSVATVDVIVADARGRPVEGLQPADFDVREDGTLQLIDTVRFIKADLPPPPETLPPIHSELDEQQEARRNGTRLFALFLDEYHVSAGRSTERVRAVARDFVDRVLRPRDLVIVMKPLDSLLTIRLARDRDQIREAIDLFQGRKGDYTPRNTFERNFIAGSPSSIEQVRAQVTTSALNALASHLGRLAEGRKTIVVVSEGFERAARRRGLELPSLDSVARVANRFNVSIYAVDPADARLDRDRIASGPSAPAPPADDATGARGPNALTLLAADTDGQVIDASSDLEANIRRIASDSSAYYLITYRPSRADDGRFHDVRVETTRPGLQVRARKGYWATTPDEAARARRSASAAGPLPPAVPSLPRRISPLIKPWIGLARGADGKTRVTFVWEPVAAVPGDRSRRRTASRLVLTALAPDGTTVFEGPVLPTGAGPDGRVGEPVRAVFDVPPGRLALRMAIEDQASQVIDSDVRDVAVRELKGPVALGTPQLLRARNAREFRNLDGNPDAAPVASRDFSRTERLLIRVSAYVPGDSVPAVSARLLNRTGRAMRDLAVEPAPAPSGQHEIDLPLAGLAAGEYSVELIVRSPAGEARDVLAFRVTS